MNNITQIILKIIIIILCIIGSFACIHYIIENCLNIKSEKEKSFLAKNDNTAYLLLNVDKIGDKLEYYIRNIQNDIKNKKCTYINKIILYSENLACSQNEDESSYQEIARICELLTVDYVNIIFVKGNFTDNVFAL